MVDNFPESDRLQGGDSEMKGKGHGQQEDKHMQKGLDMFATGSNTGRITSASCEARGARIGAGLGMIGRPGVQRRQALLGTSLDTFPGTQREGGPCEGPTVSTSAMPAPAHPVSPHFHLCGTKSLPQPQLTLSDLGRAAPTVL